MNVLILTSHLNTGGITRYVFNLAKGLASRGHLVFVGSRGGSWESRFLDAGIRLISLPLDTKSILSWKILKAYFTLSAFLNQNKMDMIHCNTRVTQFLGFLLWRGTSIPYVCTFHGYYRSHLWRKILKCEGLTTIAISYDVKDHMIKDLGMKDGKIRVVYHGIDPEDYQLGLSKEDVKKKHGINGNPILGIVARLSPEKNHKTLVEAFELFLHDYPKAVLVILGEGRLGHRLRLLVSGKKIESQVVFLENVGVGEVIPCFDIFVMPSLKEGFGLSVLESMVLEVPVVVSGVGGLKEIVEDKISGLVLRRFDDPKELSNRLELLMEDQTLRYHLVHNAKGLVMDKFSLHKMIESTESVYREALTSPGIKCG